jgi:predicted acetyltransferase
VTRSDAPALTLTDTSTTLEPITRESASILDHLIELYAHDFSEHVPLPIKPSGRFEIAVGEEWWTRDDHFPYLIRWQGELSGFALVRQGSRVSGAADVMDVAEFFVLRGARGKGIGRSAAFALFRAFHGAWEVRVRRTNAPALHFWSRVVADWLGHPMTSSSFSSDGVDWELLQFVTARSAG